MVQNVNSVIYYQSDIFNTMTSTFLYTTFKILDTISGILVYLHTFSYISIKHSETFLEIHKYLYHD